MHLQGLRSHRVGSCSSSTSRLTSTARVIVRRWRNSLGSPLPIGKMLRRRMRFGRCCATAGKATPSEQVSWELPMLRN